MHAQSISAANHQLAHHHHDTDATDVFGFWLYIMTDCILFACLFATYIVLTGPSAFGPTLKSFVDLKGVLIETFSLLISNFTFCLAMLSLYKRNLFRTQLWLLITFIFGAAFIYLEVSEFFDFAHEGFRWDVNGQASAFFTLVGTHGLHVSFGLLWILTLIFQLPLIKQAHIALRRMTYLGLFWNFLDIVWIFVFTVVYLKGAM